MEKQEFMEKAAKMMAMAAAALFGRDGGLTAESALDEHSTKIRLREGGNYVVWHISDTGRITYFYGGLKLPAAVYEKYYSYHAGDDHALVLNRLSQDFILFSFILPHLALLEENRFEITAQDDNLEAFAAVMCLKTLLELLNEMNSTKADMEENGQYILR